MSRADEFGEWDVVVVGAGPAGAAAARSAARAGARTLLLERASLPRYKTCGGGLVGTSLAALPTEVRPRLHDVITTATFTYRGRFPRTRRHHDALVRMVYRDEFDAALARAAVDAGVSLRDRTTVRSVEQEPDGAVLTTNRGVVRARAVVGADGSASRLARHVGVQCDQVDLGLEVELESGSLAAAWRGRIHIDWGPLPGSYAWVFPKDGSLSVGVIAPKGDAGATRSYLQRFVGQTGLGQLRVLRDSGHLTRCRTDTSPLARGRVLVAGDAAGLLEPFTREGISFALRSGDLAGLAAARTARFDNPGRAVADYRAEVLATLGGEMAAGRTLLAAFRRRPAAFHAGLIATWPAFARFSTGEATFERVLSHKPVAMLTELLAF
jgi:geranylgeranyl reductase family protein